MKKVHHEIFDDFSLARSGPLFRFLVRMRLMRPDLEPVWYRALFVALLAWLPLLLFSAFQGLALGGPVQVPFLHDFTVSIRLLLALPLLVVADRVIESRSSDAVRHFIDSGLVADQDSPKYQSIVRQIVAIVNSVAAEGAIVAFVVLSSSFLRLEFSGTSSTWQFMSSSSGMTRTPAGWWHLVVSIPIFQFLLWRWLWRYFAWSWFLWRVSRLDLRLIPTHPDRVAGLAFLGIYQRKFCIIIFAISSVLSAHIGQEILFGASSLHQYTTMILGNVVLILTIFLGPLFAFIPKLIEAQRRGILEYSALANGYTQAFDRKWIRGGAPEGEELIGSSDIQSLADLANSFTVIRDMGFIPFDIRLTIIPIVASAVIPFLPLVLTVFPLEEIVRKIIGIVL